MEKQAHELTLDDVKQKFSHLINKIIMRETVSDWARQMRHNIEDRKVKIKDERNEKVIWEAVLYLEGCDTPDFDDEYLLTELDLENYYKRLEILTK